MARASAVSKRAVSKGTGSIDHEAIAEAVAHAARREGAYRVADALAEHHVPRAQWEAVARALKRRGLEVGARHVRVPVRDQLAARLTDARIVAMRGVHDAVAGASKGEATAASQELVDEGIAQLAVRSSELVLLDARTATLDESEVARLEALAASLTRTLRLARRKNATLVRADVEEAFASAVPRRAAAIATSGRNGAKEPPPKPGRTSVAATVDRLRETSGLAFVPAVVRALGGANAVTSVHAELLRAAREGVLELRPESGLGRLSAEDAALCVPGPRGSTLSWVRRVRSEEEA